jgi:pimeloyl-ACP methyl ester carboxylesterase
MPSAAAEIAASVGDSPLASQYPDVNWEAMFRKTGELATQRYDWSASVAGIKAPTLLIFADADMIHPEHIAEFYKLLGGGQRDADLPGAQRSQNSLAVIPNTTHRSIIFSEAVTRFATEFLKAE